MKIFKLFVSFWLLFHNVISCDQNFNSIFEKSKIEDESLCFKHIKSYYETEMLDKLIDTWSDFAAEYTYGNSYDFGNFDECLELSNEKIKTKYCLIQYHYKPTSNNKIIEVAPNRSFYNFGWNNINKCFGGAICVPESCTVEDIEGIMEEVFKESDYMKSIYYDQTQYCKKSSSHYKIDALTIFSFAFFAVILTLVIFGTYFTNLKSESTFIKYIQCFSLIRNVKSLINLSTDKSTISCMNGIKVIATFGIIYVHYLILRMAYPFKDSSESYKIINESLFYTFSMSFVVYIEVFFVISGVLLGRTLKNSENIDIWKMSLQRYMRLTPSVYVLILILSISFAFVHSDKAPYLFPKTAFDNLYNYGYTTLLHLQVYTNPRNMCFPHCWFMAVNFQLGVIAPLIEIGLRKQKIISREFGYGMIILLGLGLRFLTFLNHESYFEGDLSHASNSESLVIAKTYYPTHLWILPFFTGILLAQILDIDQKQSIFCIEKIKKVIMKFGLFVSIAYIIIFTFIYPSTKILTIFYLTFFIMSTSFIIYACHCGFGGIINDFLSSKYWIPISKMSLSIYLISPAIQTYNIIMKKRPIEYEKDFNIFSDTVYDLLTSFPTIILLYLFIETPFTLIGKLITKKK